MLEPRSPELDHAATSQQLHSRKLKTAQIGSMVLTEDQKKQLRNWRTQVASAGATIVSSTCGTPIENLKVRMQSHDFKSVSECARYTWRTEGIRGYTAGAITPLMSITTVRVLSFSVYQKVKYQISGFMEHSLGLEAPLVAVNTPGSLPTISTISCFAGAGMAAGFCTAPLACPFELAKNVTQTSVLMTNKPGVHRTPSLDAATKMAPRISTAAAITQIVKIHGLRSLYKGFWLHQARDTIGSGIYFSIYESAKQASTTFLGAQKANEGLPVMFASILSGLTSWAATYPLDIRKTQAQSSLLGKAKAAADTAMPRSSYRGLQISLLRTVVTNIVFWSLFEELKKQINAHNPDQKPGEKVGPKADEDDPVSKASGGV